jgi:Sporulation and spore germination
MKKKLFILFISTLFSLSLIGCNKIADAIKPEKQKTKEESKQEPNEDSKGDSTKENKDKEKPIDDKKNENTDTKENKITKKDCRIYAFNSQELKLYYYDKTIQVEDKALVKALTNELQNNLPNDDFLALTKEIGVTSAKLDEKSGVLTVVFSDSFSDKMTLGSATESGLASSLICTYAYNFGVDKVAIYFGDKLYTSLRGDLPEGYFTAHFSDAEPYKTN